MWERWVGNSHGFGGKGKMNETEDEAAGMYSS